MPPAHLEDHPLIYKALALIEQACASRGLQPIYLNQSQELIVVVAQRPESLVTLLNIEVGILRPRSEDDVFEYWFCVQDADCLVGGFSATQAEQEGPDDTLEFRTQDPAADPGFAFGVAQILEMIYRLADTGGPGEKSNESHEP